MLQTGQKPVTTGTPAAWFSLIPGATDKSPVNNDRGGHVKCWNSCLKRKKMPVQRLNLLSLFQYMLQNNLYKS